MPQPMAPKSRLKDRDNPIISITIVMKMPAVRDSNRVRTVSYTHLDVYKRQAQA